MLDVFFGSTVILACGISKIPQILRVQQTRNTHGLSVVGILMELYCHGLNIGFFILSSYPLINYLEYPLLLSQNLLLLLLTGSINRNLKSSVLQSFAIILFISCIGGGFLPMSIVLGALSMNGLIGVSAKIAQIQSIRRAGNSDSVSYTFYLINILTSSMRVYTNIMLPNWEMRVVFNLAIVMVANVVVCITIFLYKTCRSQLDTKKTQ